MSTKCVRHHGSFRVAVVVAKRLLRNTTRGRLHLTVGRVQILPSPPTTRAKFTIQYIFTVSQKSGIPDQHFVFLLAIFDLIFKLGLTTFPVGPKSGGSSDTSPPLQSFAEESSPENLMRNGQSTESLDSLSDESGGVHHHSRSHNRSSSGAEIRPRNVRPSPRQVRKLQ